MGFTALSRICHLYRADRSSKVGENRRTRGNHLAIRKQNLAFPMWPERGSNHSGEKPNRLRVTCVLKIEQHTSASVKSFEASNNSAVKITMRVRARAKLKRHCFDAVGLLYINVQLIFEQYDYVVNSCVILYSRLPLSRIPRDSPKYFEISVPRHIRFAELRKK